MIHMIYTDTGRIYTQDGNKYELVEDSNGAYRLITNDDKVFFGLDIEKFDITKHLVK